jgi:pyridinium-3,5-biscarboxylic acid mononucleotide sulfurtransferase
MLSPTNAVAALSLDLTTRLRCLDDALRPIVKEGLLVAYSGGVDSAFLAWAAERVRKLDGGRILTITAVSASLATREREDAVRFAQEIGVEHRLQDTNELSNPAYVRNDSLRCYHCKAELFSVCREIAKRENLRHIAYGYNASDHGDNRPGHRAASEFGIMSPLNDAGLRKDDIRALMRAFGLPLAEKPASPCLSSRLMTGVHVTPEKLRVVEEIETLIRSAGIKVFRVRLHEHGDLRWLRLEVAPDQIGSVLTIREALQNAAIMHGFVWMTLDLGGYRTGGGTFLRRYD